MNINKILLSGLFFIPGLYSMAAQATCTFLSGSATDASAVNFGNVIIQRDAPIGSVVATTISNVFNSRGNFIHCVTAPPLTLRWSTEGTSSFILNGEQLFNTGISGLALRVTNRPYGANGYSGNFPRDYTYGGCTANVPTTWRRYCGVSWGAGVQFDLVKVSHPTGSGALAIPGRFRASIVNETFVYSYNVSSSNVSTVACSVTNTSINVPMGNVQRSTFTGVGHEGNPVQFFIPLDCDAATRVNFKIDATADSSGVPGVMAINSSATGNAASGVGIKITRSGAPVAFGTVIPVGTVANAGMFNIPLIAQYYQTLPNVTAGQANGTATFTMTYN
ncbi:MULTISPECIES: fimbrial protein [Pseudomonas]|uniref:fimbrial protein n=1 Tax=Pseudomonas TaxID=286 RepID=UPI000D7374BD|nr:MULTISPECIES: fimbrial protein [Pseudomonas]PWY53219.1 hypothetical protein DK261_01695 [Pseudomonas sp. RW409]WJV25024.1 fimbrial protein [Pseudomonas chlororaphis]